MSGELRHRLGKVFDQLQALTCEVDEIRNELSRGPATDVPEEQQVKPNYKAAQIRTPQPEEPDVSAKQLLEWQSEMKCVTIVNALNGRLAVTNAIALPPPHIDLRAAFDRDCRILVQLSGRDVWLTLTRVAGSVEPIKYTIND